MLEKHVIFPFSSINYMFSVNYIFFMNITYIFAIITCLGFLVMRRLPTQSTTATGHKFGDCGYDNDTAYDPAQV